MGLRAEIFVAEPTDARNYEAAQRTGSVRPPQYTRVQLGGLLDLHLSILWAIALGEEWDIDKHALMTIHSASETWLYRFPETFTHLLASLDDERIEAISTAWSETEETRCEPSDAQYVLENLCELSRKAEASGKSLHLWGSL